MLLAFSSCSSDKKEGGSVKRKAVTAKVQSAPYELLVVVNKDWLKTATGQRFVDIVNTPIEGLPQVEPHFRVTYINPDAFKGTFRTYANILVADIGSKHAEPNIREAVNVYAQPQRIVYVNAPDNETFVAYMEAYGLSVLNAFNRNEFTRERALLSKNYSGAVASQAKKMFGVDIRVPQDIDDVKTGKNFLWASASKQEFRLNICLYTLPVKAEGMILEEYVAARDSVMKINIPGGREDQWMETDIRTVSGSMAEQASVDGHLLLAYRGLWSMRHDAMGGPFVCYVYMDEKNGCLLVAEGFVFAPEEKKRAVIRQLEAALQTIVLPTAN